MAFNCELEALSLRSYILRDESLARLSTLGAKGTRAAPARLMRSLAFPQLRGNSRVVWASISSPASHPRMLSSVCYCEISPKPSKVRFGSRLCENRDQRCR